MDLVWVICRRISLGSEAILFMERTPPDLLEATKGQRRCQRISIELLAHRGMEHLVTRGAVASLRCSLSILETLNRLGSIVARIPNKVINAGF